MPNNFSWQLDPDTLNNILTNYKTDVKGSQISTEINNYSRFVLNQVDNLQKEGPKPSSTLPAADIEEFAELLALVIDSKQDYEGTPLKDRIEVREKYVNIKPERDVIGWCVKERRPGLMARGKVGDKGVQEYSMHQRAVFDDPHQPGHAIVAYGQKMDNFLELCVMSGDAQSANRRALWLEDTISEAQWIFQYCGFERVLFHKREADKFMDIGSNPCHERPLIYYVRTEKITLYRVAVLKKLLIDLCLTPPGQMPIQSSKFKSIYEK